MVTITYEEILDSDTTAELEQPIQRCTLTSRASERVRVLLLPGGMFVPDPTASLDLPNDDLLLALIQIILTHGSVNGQPPRTGSANEARLPGWPDLPAIVCTHSQDTADVDHYRAERGADSASLALTRGTRIVIGWSWYTLKPSRDMLIALGRMIWCHRLQVHATGVDSPAGC